MFEIVPFGEFLVPEAARLERLCFSSPWSENMLLGELRSPLSHWFAAVEEGRLAGYAGMQAVLDEGYVANVAVAPDARRRGIGEALMGALISFGRDNSLSFITLEARASNAPALALYSKLGFAEAGRRRGYYSAPVEDAVLMTYRFEVEK